MYRPRVFGGARSTTIGPSTTKWMHSPTPNAIETMQRITSAAVVDEGPVAASTPSEASVHNAAMKSSAAPLL
jgi:hypothetical protein